MERMFEYATRMKLRFPFKGQASVEDLWDMDVNSLDAVYTTVNHSLKAIKDEGLLKKSDSQVGVYETMLAIIKHVYDVKMKEAEDRANEKARKERKQRIAELIAQKQDTELAGKSVEELNALLEAM